MQGQGNSDLDALGKAQAEVNGQLLSTRDIGALYASPLGRTRQTAEIVNRYLNLSIQYDARIKEWDCGVWSGYLYADVETRWAEEWAALRADRFHYRGPGCENYPDMIARTAGFLDELRAHPASNLAIISHGIIGRVMISALLGLDEAATLRISQPNDTVFRVTLGPGGHAVVERYVDGYGPLEGLEH